MSAHYISNTETIASRQLYDFTFNREAELPNKQESELSPYQFSISYTSSWLHGLYVFLVSLCVLPFHISSFSKQHEHAEAIPESEPGQNECTELG